jgi:hypothetical protein
VVVWGEGPLQHKVGDQLWSTTCISRPCCCGWSCKQQGVISCCKLLLCHDPELVQVQPCRWVTLRSLHQHSLQLLIAEDPPYCPLPWRQLLLLLQLAAWPPALLHCRWALCRLQKAETRLATHMTIVCVA